MIQAQGIATSLQSMGSRGSFNSHLKSPYREGSVDYPSRRSPISLMNSQRKKYPGLRPTAQQLIRTLGVELAERMASGRLCTDFGKVRATLLTFISPQYRIYAACHSSALLNQTSGAMPFQRYIRR